jgi:hypothetical protein
MMADASARALPTVEDVDRLQTQINDLTEVLEAHQRLFERLRAAGLLPGDEPGGGQ